MKTLVITPTYARLPYLGRLLSSFNNQNYDDKHLVIVNDDSDIRIRCNQKNVTVINCNSRLSVSNKRNLGIASTTADLILPHDDDDIFTPNRISNHVKAYQYDPSIKAYRNTESYIIYGDEFIKSNSSPHNAISFLKDEWFRVGGYKSDCVRYQDVYFHDSLNNLKISKSEMDFIYQFGGVNYHGCCLGDNHEEVTQEISKKQLTEIGLIGSDFWIEPSENDYKIILDIKDRFDTLQMPIKVKHISDAKLYAI